jgi:hypothetical protein
MHNLLVIYWRRSLFTAGKLFTLCSYLREQKYYHYNAGSEGRGKMQHVKGGEK